MKLATYILAALLAGCATPSPVPTPTPTPADPFAGAVVDCETPQVQAEAPRVYPLAGYCLSDGATASCLVSMLDTYRMETIACVVRDLATEANERVLAGKPGGADSIVDNAARAWLTSERIGFR